MSNEIKYKNVNLEKVIFGNVNATIDCNLN